MATTELEATIRTSRGSAESRRLRRTGFVPATVYGRDSEAKAVTVNSRELYAVLHTDAGLNAVITLNVDGEAITSLAREVQRHPTRGDITHLDFIRISLTETVTADVGIDFEGLPQGVRDGEGIVETIRSVITVEALATDIPSSIPLDISELNIGDVLRVSDLPVIPGVEYTDDPEASLVTVSVPAAVISEEAELAEGEEGEEGEEGAEPGEEGAEAGEGAEGGAGDSSDDGE
ncbi:MAG: 50S ribosomal protein L25 [Acidimicrobiia bacterium]|nr:50S ribosomal protein L25 [Acidimicrobiia bacterium]